MKRATVKKTVLEASEGVVATVVDLTLVSLYMALALSSVRTMNDAFRITEDIYSFKDRVNYHAIKRALYNLTRKGLVTRSSKRTEIELAITELGRKRIAELLPTYQTDRPWDHFVYLISYDIPTEHNRSRDMLREYIKRTGGALLQESLWINPYNPTILLETFAKEHDIPGTILVSKLGKDGAIGEDNLRNVIRRVYKLEEISRRYHEFLKEYADQKNTKPSRMIFNYLAILKDDPQLPFALLPHNFPGQKAYECVRLDLSRLSSSP